MNPRTQRDSREIEREIVEIQTIDSKIKKDLHHLKERLRINN